MTTPKNEETEREGDLTDEELADVSGGAIATLNMNALTLAAQEEASKRPAAFEETSKSGNPVGNVSLPSLKK